MPMGDIEQKREKRWVERSSILAPALACGLLLAGCHQPSTTTDGTNPIVQTESVTNYNITGTVDTTVRRGVTTPNAGVLEAVVGRNGLRVASGQALAKLQAGDVYLRRSLAQQKLASIIRQRSAILDRWRLENGVPRGSTAAVPQDRSADILAAKVSMQYAATELQRARSAASGRTDLRAAVSNADLSVASAQQNMAGDLAAVRAAESQLPIAQTRYNSLKRLYGEQAASREELRTALGLLQDAAGKVDTTRATYNRDLLTLYAARRAAADARNRLNNPDDLRTQVLAAQEHYAQSVLAYRRALTPTGATPTTPEGVRLPPDTSAVDTDIIVAKADLANAESDVQRLVIRAPMDGTVTDWTAKVGENVQAGQSLGSVVDLKQLTVTVEVSPQLIPYMLTGTRLRVTLQGPSHSEFEGKVEAISPTLDPQTNKQKVEISVYDKEEKLSPGADVTVEPVGK